MPADSSSDSEDDIQLRQFMEAADTTLLTNAMFQKTAPTSKPVENISETTATEDPPLRHTELETEQAKAVPKSQRYLPDDEANVGADLNLPATVQRHVSKKLSALIEQTFEFCDTSRVDLPSKSKKFKSKVKLVQDADCYVKPYEEFEYETRGPEKKPEIKRRKVDDERDLDAEEQLKAAAVTPEDILSGKSLQGWSEKEKADKVFHYRAGDGGVLHAKQVVNEFTKLRHKNKWSEAKIKQTKIPKIKS